VSIIGTYHNCYGIKTGLDTMAGHTRELVLRGCVVVWATVVELALFLVPISVVQYMPNFFFGSLLMLFGIEITLDWLIHSFKKVWHASLIAHMTGLTVFPAERCSTSLLSSPASALTLSSSAL
jgi:SulP family sulfate permease